MKAKDIMTTPVVTVKPHTSLREVSTVLVDRGISAVPVVDQAGELVGIVSEADIVPLETASDPRSRILPVPRRSRHEGPPPRGVSDVMTREVATLPEDADVADVARLMLEKGVKRIPIVSGKRVAGIISRRDILKVLVRSDEEIRVEVEALLRNETLMLDEYRAEVADGTVLLFGPRDPSRRQLAEIVARGVPGVVTAGFGDEP